MRRREFITLLGGTAVAWPCIALGQQVSQTRIVQVSPWQGTEHLARAFEQKLGELGYVNGKQIHLSNLYVPPQPDAIQTAIRGILSNVDLLVVWSTVATVNAKQVVAGSKPIIFLSVGVPVDIGLVESLSRPGGNMTGVTFEAATEFEDFCDPASEPQAILKTEFAAG
jgi:ABC-type uncharacterized transport system substrate-binding protein